MSATWQIQAILDDATDGLRLVMHATREIDGEASTRTRYYLLSRAFDPARFNAIVRSHWGIENSLHWVMDMVFRDDECRVRTDHAPANFTTIKHLAYNLIRKVPGKDSFRLKRKIAA